MATTQKIIPKWKNKWEFLMAALGNSIGLGNLWRFPYQCFNNGGGAFLIPFIFMAITVAFPLIIADFAIAQYGQRGAQGCWEAVPLLSGIAWAINLITLSVGIMYSAIASLGPFYMFSSLRETLPWASCNNTWNTPRCHSFSDVLTSEKRNLQENLTKQSAMHWELNSTNEYLTNKAYNCSNQQTSQMKNSTLLPPRSPSDEFFHFGLYEITSGIEELGRIQWPLCLCLMFTLTVALCILSFGVRSWGKMSYITTLLPYVVMSVLLGQSLTMNGAADGVLQFLWPKWDKLTSYSVWTDAAIQVVFSLGGAGGFNLHIASHNRFMNDFIKDGILLTVCDIMTSLLCGTVIFSIIGTMMSELDVTIDDVVGKGAGMAIIVYADMLTHMPVAPVWSFIFNLMLFCLGIGPVVCLISITQAHILEVLPKECRSRQTSILILVAIVVGWFLIGLIYTTQGGMYVVQLVDGNMTVFFLLLCIAKIIAFGWIYGSNKLSNDIYAMTGWKLHAIYWIIYKFFTPAILFICLVLRLTSVDPLKYGSYVFPEWSQGLSWLLVALLTSVIPGVALYKLFFLRRNISIKERWVILTTPSRNWGPSSEDVGSMIDMVNQERERMHHQESV